ncbi:MAG: YdcF family protein [Propionibacteriaceae bacterium]|nr:YdcF family protein [Propionibacteriaceae bacterium]
MEKPKPKKRLLRRLVLILLVLIVLGLTTPFIVTGIVTSGKLQSIDEAEPHDVAIVFGAGLYGDQPTPYLQGRLEVARDLFFAGKVRVILVSGDNLTDEHNEPAVMKAWLIDNGIPANKIVSDYAGIDTYSTCVRAKEIFGVTSAILVSQTYHLPRAVTTCQLVGVDVVGVGDETVRYISNSWKKYSAREIPATINMAYEVLIHRRTILGDYESGVDDALNS